VEVDDTPVEALDEEGGRHEEEASQNDEVDVVTVEQRQEELLAVELGLADDNGRDVEVAGPSQCIGIGTVADDKSCLDQVGALEIADDVFAVGSAS